jgi:hypothetical protein
MPKNTRKNSDPKSRPTTPLGWELDGVLDMTAR